MRDEDVWQAILQKEPALAALFGRSPAYRYFTYRGHRFCWTTERMSDGTFAAFEYRPVGPGSRTGKARKLRKVREVRFKTRRAAKARAGRWHDALVRRYEPEAIR